MSLRNMASRMTFGLVSALAAAALLTMLCSSPASAQEELNRKVKNKVSPVYPELARRMSISGTVKVLVVVGQNGVVKSSKVVGGHPLLANAAMDALKKWKFETASEESTGVVEFKFSDQ